MESICATLTRILTGSRRNRYYWSGRDKADATALADIANDHPTWTDQQIRDRLAWERGQ